MEEAALRAVRSPWRKPIWIAAGVRSPFMRAESAFAELDAMALSTPVVRTMLERLAGNQLDFAVWGAAVPNLGWSNLAREVLLEAGAAPTVPAFSTSMAGATSMIGVIEAAGMIDGRTRHLALVGGVESMSRVQVGLEQDFSDWVRGFMSSRSLREKLRYLRRFSVAQMRLQASKIPNRRSGSSAGEHTETTAKKWGVTRREQDEVALMSHINASAAWREGFYDDLVTPIGRYTRDNIVRQRISLERLAQLQPAFDRLSGAGTLTAGNSSVLTDGAAAVWVGSDVGLARLPDDTPRARLLDYEISAVDPAEGLLMAPTFAVPRLLQRNGLRFDDVHVWEIHEAFAAQVAICNRAWNSEGFLSRAGVTVDLGMFPRQRVNIQGGSIALGHPFGATGARILSQAVKMLAARLPGSRAIVSVCADGGVGAVALLGN